MRIDQRESGKLGQVDAETDDGRNATGPCKHRDVAGCAAGASSARALPLTSQLPTPERLNGKDEALRSRVNSGGLY